MHRALFVAEILLEIFTHLTPLEEPVPRDEISTSSGLQELFWAKNPLSWDVTSRRYLAALARTCKTFHEPAMDLLWADTDVYGIEPLLGCVTRLHPLIYWGDRIGRWSQRFFEPGHSGWSEGIEPLSEHETQQFLRHAARVRYLSIRWSKNHLDLLTTFPIEARIFPRLLALQWGPNTNARMHLFLSPTLRRCALRAVHSDFKSIGTCLPGLESLSDDRGDFRASDVSLLSEAVRSCRQLKHLSCSWLDSAAWKHLSNLPNFTTAVMYGTLNEVTLDLDGVILTPFLNITSIYFGLDSALNIITILQHSKLPSLKKFIVSVNALHSSEAEQLCHALTQCNTCHTLQYVSINSSNPTDERPHKPLAVIKPFLCLPQLRHLRLTLCRSIYLDNDLLLEAMSSWPHIHALDLDSTGWRNDNPPPTNTVTFYGLFAALRLCPQLIKLSLEMDAANIDIDIESETFQHTSLKYLNVGSSIAKDPEAIIRIISTMLPSVRELHNHNHGETGRVWNRVSWFFFMKG